MAPLSASSSVGPLRSRSRSRLGFVSGCKVSKRCDHVGDDRRGGGIVERDAGRAGDGDDLADRALEDLATEWGGAHGACRTEGEPTDRGERCDERELAPQLGVDLTGDGRVDAGLAQGRREGLQAIGWPFLELADDDAPERAESLDDARRRAGGADVGEAAGDGRRVDAEGGEPLIGADAVEEWNDDGSRRGERLEDWRDVGEGVALDRNDHELRAGECAGVIGGADGSDPMSAVGLHDLEARRWRAWH